MSWDTTRGLPYFYVNDWIDGRSKRRYVGYGPLADLAASHGDLRRVEREAQRRERRAEDEPWAAAEAALSALGGLTDLALRAALAVAGYHQHARGAWRKRRERREDGDGG
jgi:hypothetical protein